MQEKIDKILLFGYKKYGSKIANNLKQNGYFVIVVDNDKDAIDKAIKQGFDAYLIDLENDEDIVNILVKYDFSHIFCAMDKDEENIYITITMRSLQNNIDYGSNRTEYLSFS